MSTTGSTIQNPLYLRVFLASPGDVVNERSLALEVLERLQYDPLLRGLGRVHKIEFICQAIAWLILTDEGRH